MQADALPRIPKQSTALGHTDMKQAEASSQASAQKSRGPAGKRIALAELLDVRYAEAAADAGNFINEHIPTLYEYARLCEHVTECGVETANSSWAFARGLRDNGRSVKTLVSVDLNYHPTISHVRAACASNGIDFTFKQGNDIYIALGDTDMIFIDTWHVYGHLKRELDAHHSRVARWIVMHDTEVDGVFGETLRRKWDPWKQAIENAYPVEEVKSGLRPAINEFLAEHPEWRMTKRWTNCNGLTVLQRRSYGGPVPDIPGGDVGEPSDGGAEPSCPSDGGPDLPGNSTTPDHSSGQGVASGSGVPRCGPSARCQACPSAGCCPLVDACDSDDDDGERGDDDDRSEGSDDEDSGSAGTSAISGSRVGIHGDRDGKRWH